MTMLREAVRLFQDEWGAYQSGSGTGSHERRWLRLERSVEGLFAALAADEGELERYRTVFGHYHVAGTTKGLDIDTCAQCGLDLRDEIHLRAGKGKP